MKNIEVNQRDIWGAEDVYFGQEDCGLCDWHDVAIPVESVLENLLITGEIGTGKTTLASGVTAQVVESGAAAVMIDPLDLVTEEFCNWFERKTDASVTIVDGAGGEHRDGIRLSEVGNYRLTDAWDDVYASDSGYTGPLMEAVVSRASQKLSESDREASLENLYRVLQSPDDFPNVVDLEMAEGILSVSQEDMQPVLKRLQLAVGDTSVGALLNADDPVDVSGVISNGDVLIIKPSPDNEQEWGAVGALLNYIVERVRQVEDQRVLVTVDEYQRLAASTGVHPFEKLRGENIGCCLVTNSLTEIPSDIRNGVLSNSTNLVSYTMSDTQSANEIAGRFGDRVTRNTLMDLAQFEGVGHLKGRYGVEDVVFKSHNFHFPD